uniref:RRM domain-containing protein n=1 Tax=Tetradesmus obliquus TaxID=3088 RepID=A0A383WMK1_TETOB|eukprot:jgi/Sobl393_1/10833/SZX77966.1
MTRGNPRTLVGSSSTVPSRVCRLRGLPFRAENEDIEEFFSCYTLDDVYICRRDGRATGDAYVVFCDASQASSAMDTRNGRFIGSRYIEMFEATEDDLAAVKRVLEDPLQGFVVRLRGLGYTAAVEDVAHFLEGVQLAQGDDAILLTTTEDGRASGECYVELADAAARSLAMARHRELMGSRYIEVLHSTREEKLQAQQAELDRWGVLVLVQPGLAMPHGMQPAVPHGMQPAVPHVQPPVPHMQPVIQPAMAPETQPAVLAAAVAAGSRITCEVGQLASTLQGMHLNGSVDSSVMSPIQQQQPLYPLAYPQSQMLAPLQTVSMPLTTCGSLLDSSSGSSNSSSSSSNSVSDSSSVLSMGSSTLSVPSVTAAHAPAADVLYYQASTAAASAALTQPGVTVMSPAASYGNVMPCPPGPAPVQAPMQQQQQPGPVHYVPMQQAPRRAPLLLTAAAAAAAAALMPNTQLALFCCILQGPTPGLIQGPSSAR